MRITESGGREGALKMRMGMSIAKVPTPDRERPRSLRLRLVLWYGTLLAAALGLFVVLLLVLAMDEFSQSVDGDVQAEARIATLNVDNHYSRTFLTEL